MKDRECNHCGQRIDDDAERCPYCGTPTAARRDADFVPRQRRFVLLFVALAVFCAIMILWLPRVLRG